MSALPRLRDLLRNRNGSIAITFALSLVPMLALSGAAVDYGRATNARAKLQAALDGIVLSLALQASEMAPDDLTAQANALLAARIGPDSIQALKGTIAWNADTGTLAFNGTGDVPTVVLKAVGFHTIAIGAAAETRVTGEPFQGACVIALDPSSNAAFNVSGSGSVNVPNCGIHVNSGAPNAIRTQGAAKITAKWIKVVGGRNGTGFTPMPQTQQPAEPDPLASIPEPTPPAGCNYFNHTFATPTTLPSNRTYCGNISLAANVVFGSGIHYFKNATVTTGTNVNITGSRVMLYFDANSSLASTSGGIVSLSPPTSGTYRGIVMFGSRSANAPTFTFTGNKDYVVKGTLYLPRAVVAMTGNADLSVNSDSGYVISWRFSYTGNSSFTFSAHGAPNPDKLSGQQSVSITR